MKKVLFPVLVAVFVFSFVKVIRIHSQTNTPANDEVATWLKSLEKHAKTDARENARKMTPADLDRQIQSFRKLLQKYEGLQKETVYPFESEVLWFLTALIKKWIATMETEKATRKQTAATG